MKMEKNIRRTKIGGFSLVSVAIVIVIVVLANLAVNILPSTYTKLSLSSLGIYDITDATKELVKAVKDDVDIYVVANGANSETSSSLDKTVYEYVKRVGDLNSHIKVSTVDPLLKPSFISAYTDEELDTSSTNIIVVNKTQSQGDTKRATVIPYSDIYYQQYSEYEVYYYSMMGYSIDNPTYFNLEGELASAIDYVTTAKLPKIYYTTGHGESDIDATVAGLIEDENISVAELATLTVTEIPSDCDLIIMHNPTTDLTEAEVTLLKNYIDNGGKFILTTGIGNNLVFYDLPNLYAMTEAYGMIYNKALVMEGSSGSYYQAPYYILPQITENDFSSSVPSNTYVVLPLAHEIKIAETLPDSVTVDTLFTTTVKGYVKENITENTNFNLKEDGDREGNIVVGAMASKDEGRFMWVAASDILNGGTAGQFSNVTYMMSAITSFCDKETTVTASAKALQIEALNVTEGSAELWGIILIGIVPLIILGTGIAVFVVRKKR